MSESLIIGLGALNADRIYRVKELRPDGETTIESAEVYPGGSAANTIYGLARLGMATAFCGAVGNDRYGRLMLSDLRKVGTDISHIVRKPEIESGAVICLSAGPERTLYVMPGANNKLSPEDIDRTYLARANWLHLSSFAGDAQFVLTQEIVASLPRSIKLSFSPGEFYAKRGLAELRPLLERTDILFLNRYEARLLTGQSFTAGALSCIGIGCRIVVITLGRGLVRRGVRVVAYVNNGGKATWVYADTANDIAVADTTGAGDAFASGFLFGAITRQTTAKCGEYGHASARLSLGACGARKGLPTQNQLIREHRRLYGQSNVIGKCHMSPV
ncbi:MAG: carbohydrate kinase family protein [Dehalococcoidia bacterium]|nr:carbohydrate kinase family protein [Dehalococcoidia bacterium]